MLLSDIRDYLNELEPLAWFAALDPVRQRAIVNMRHQLGLDGLLEFHIMIACLTGHDWPGAAIAGIRSDWAKETPVRAHRIMAMLLTGEAEA